MRLLSCLIAFLILFQAPAPAQESNAELETQYRSLVKQILLSGIELERFSLNYRLAASRQSTWKWLRYGLAQEAGAVGGMTFEIIGDREFGRARRNPLKLNTKAVDRGLQAVAVTSIIAGSGSAFELSANTIRAINNYRHGYDSASATRHVVERAKHLDGLLAQHEALVRAHPESRYYDVALCENAVLKELRNSVLAEYSQFHSNVRAYRTYENLFYALNVATNVTGITSAVYGEKGLSNPKYNGSSAVLYIINGGLTIASPLISSTAGTIAGRLAKDSFYHQLGSVPHFHPLELKAKEQQLESAVSNVDLDNQKARNAVIKLAGYEDTEGSITRNLKYDTKVFRYLTATAVQSDLFGPAIGGTLLYQGILSAKGYYKYGNRPLKALDAAYKGSVAGTVGTSVAVGGTALGIAGNYWEYYRLYKRHRLPKQLIKARLEKLDEMEKTVQTTL